MNVNAQTHHRPAGQKGQTMAFHFTGRSFYFGAYSRYLAREVVTRFGSTEWGVTDAESISDDEVEAGGLPELVRQFDTRAELDEFVEEVEAELALEHLDVRECARWRCRDEPRQPAVGEHGRGAVRDAGRLLRLADPRDARPRVRPRVLDDARRRASDLSDLAPRRF